MKKKNNTYEIWTEVPARNELAPQKLLARFHSARAARNFLFQNKEKERPKSSIWIILQSQNGNGVFMYPCRNIPKEIGNSFPYDRRGSLYFENPFSENRFIIIKNERAFAYNKQDGIWLQII